LRVLDTETAGLERRQRCAIRRLCVGVAVDAGKPLSPQPAHIVSPDSGGRHIGGKVSAIFLAWCARLYGRAFGRLPHTTRWHPYHTMLRPVMAAVAGAADVPEMLVVSSGGMFASLIVSGLKGRKLIVAPGMLDSEFYQKSFRDRGGFDLCLCDLAVDDLLRFRRLLERISPLLNKRSRIIVFHQNRAGRVLDDWTHEFARGLFPVIGRSKIAFAGSYPGALSMRWFANGLEHHNISRPSSVISLGATLAICAPLARLASLIEERRGPYRMPSRCTSMTIVIDLP
jgi:hypothetical protein